MGAAYFYHLTRRPLEATLYTLLEKSLAAGWRVSVRGSDTAGLAALDRALWREPPDGFLPHGLAGGPHDAAQPILLQASDEPLNAPDCVMTVHGAPVSAQEVAKLQRVCVLFDGRDEAAVDQARAQWKQLTAAGAAAQYWSEDSGRWEMKAQSGG